MLKTSMIMHIRTPLGV